MNCTFHIQKLTTPSRPVPLIGPMLSCILDGCSYQCNTAVTVIQLVVSRGDNNMQDGTAQPMVKRIGVRNNYGRS